MHNHIQVFTNNSVLIQLLLKKWTQWFRINESFSIQSFNKKKHSVTKKLFHQQVFSSRRLQLFQCFVRRFKDVQLFLNFQFYSHSYINQSSEKKLHRTKPSCYIILLNVSIHLNFNSSYVYFKVLVRTIQSKNSRVQLLW